VYQAVACENGRLLSVEESAAVLKISPQSVLRDWKLAKAWLAS